MVHRGFPGKAALIFRKKYSESRNPYAIRLITFILLLTPSSKLVCIRYFALAKMPLMSISIEK